MLILFCLLCLFFLLFILITKFWMKITGLKSSILENYQLKDIIKYQNTIQDKKQDKK